MQLNARQEQCAKISVVSQLQYPLFIIDLIPLNVAGTFVAYPLLSTTRGPASLHAVSPIIAATSITIFIVGKVSAGSPTEVQIGLCGANFLTASMTTGKDMSMPTW